MTLKVELIKEKELSEEISEVKILKEELNDKIKLVKLKEKDEAKFSSLAYSRGEK